VLVVNSSMRTIAETIGTIACDKLHLMNEVQYSRLRIFLVEQRQHLAPNIELEFYRIPP
jgi:hypothetical protein